ncbi:molybdopterin converting factor [Cohnella kolymensis]|uniref:Molybdopterin converting factor n=1 Tax=Cohnella kolymensis TaxID=1590652 RepID=A0ABR5A6V7_9BACL|nr:molybdenum cofactor biosynthesis protein MoaE [Cohnella kolymensis]KIL36774.1 molybdopterin converting factor [Cohnella kolymensis]
MTTTNNWHISLFAGLAERLSTRSLQPSWEEPQLTVRQIKDRLMKQFPEQADLLSLCFMAQNQSYADDEAVVLKDDELALLPPVSGGSDVDVTGERSRKEGKRFLITEEKLDIDSVVAQISHPDHGAALAFVGTTREWTRGQRTITLQYEAYIPMAESAMEQIGEEIARKWPCTLCAIAHRIGTVGINEISVVIAVSSPHRAESYEASRYAIERLKQKVPIWKKEVYEDGTEWKGHQLGPWNPMAEIDGFGGSAK